jgi:uncharacterized protein (TIGR00725 family)
VAVAGGAGTLAEIAIAWQLGKPIVALRPSGGWAERVAGASIDGIARVPIGVAEDPAEAIALASNAISHRA